MTKRRNKQLGAQPSSPLAKDEAEIRDEAYTSGLHKYLRICVHLLGAAQFIFAVWYYWYKVHIPGSGDEAINQRVQWGGKCRFLTFLNAILQGFYHSVALLNDLLGSNAIDPTPMPFLRKLRDFLFCYWALPIAFNVSISFWIVYGWDRELIFPTSLDPYFPNWLNHIVHTNIACMAILDLFTCCRQYPKRSAGIKGAALFILSYIAWVHVVHYHSGLWVYPILNVLNIPFRYVMLSAMVAFTLCCYLMGEYLNNLIWLPELNLLKDKQLKKKE